MLSVLLMPVAAILSPEVNVGRIVPRVPIVPLTTELPAGVMLSRLVVSAKVWATVPLPMFASVVGRAA
ncbi:hypothetical protein AWB69_09239 [Caballeronia udeis]|uniref:Uncharacterized protein n=1 Tax=Caballeronia udeis TaxID=1232866 RepID=A0A158K1D9_9BURK|nr:hypothetical protein AWB69_09239 [Caballeronia udeis]